MFSGRCIFLCCLFKWFSLEKFYFLFSFHQLWFFFPNLHDLSCINCWYLALQIWAYLGSSPVPHLLKLFVIYFYFFNEIFSSPLFPPRVLMLALFLHQRKPLFFSRLRTPFWHSLVFLFLIFFFLLLICPRTTTDALWQSLLVNLFFLILFLPQKSIR